MLYIADEVVTAFGRLGHWFASKDVFDYEPDILVCAKGITSGYIPLGAPLISDELYDAISEPQCEGGVFSMGLTYFGHPVACRVALENISIIERESILSHAKGMGDYFQNKISSLGDMEYVGDVRGKGLMLSVDIVQDKAKKSVFPISARVGARVFEACVSDGLIVRPVGDRIVLSPPLTLEREHVDQMYDVLRKNLAIL